MGNPFRTSCIVLFVLIALAKASFSQEIVFSKPGGFYDNAFLLSLSCSTEGCSIHYTTNGNTPTVHDMTYSSPIAMDESLFPSSNIYTIVNCPENEWFMPDSIQKCIVIRAAAFDEAGNQIGQVVTNTYLIQSLGCDTHGLPLVSLCADSLDLFDYERGIFVPGATFDPSNPNETGNYYQSGREWERLMNIEFYELDNTGINQRAGLRTHGGNGRGIQQKCMKIYARDEYGKKRFKHKFFESIPDTSFKHLVLKPLTATWFRAGVNDHICNQIASRLNIETLASRPVALYLNGEYWGIYFIHEKPDERYLETHCHVDSENVNLIESWWGECEAGTNDSFLELYDYIYNNDLTDPEAYTYVANRIDMDNFIDYQIFEIFTANLDWPANNMRCWQEGDGRWRWIFFDGDIALIKKEFDAFANATYDGPQAYPSNSRVTLFLRKLIQNKTFEAAFINRFNQLLHSALAHENTKPFTDNALETLKGEMPNQVARFGNPESTELWESHVRYIDEFLSLRANYIYEQLAEYYLSDEYELTIDAIYPTPAQNEIRVQVHSDKTILTDIQIFDTNGRLLHTIPSAIGIGETEVTLPIHLKSGVYIVKIRHESSAFVVIR